MGLPALLSNDDAISDSDRLALKEAWAPAWSVMREAVRQQRPTDGSPEERTALLQLLTLLRDTAPLLEKLWPTLKLVQRPLSFEESVRKIARREPGRFVSARLLERAARAFGEFLAFAFARAGSVWPEDVALSGREASEEMLFNTDATRFLRAELDFFVAFDLFDGTAPDTTDEEVAYWAGRAAHGGQVLQSLMGQVTIRPDFVVRSPEGMLSIIAEVKLHASPQDMITLRWHAQRLGAEFALLVDAERARFFATGVPEAQGELLNLPTTDICPSREMTDPTNERRLERSTQQWLTAQVTADTDDTVAGVARLRALGMLELLRGGSVESGPRNPF